MLTFFLDFVNIKNVKSRGSSVVEQRTENPCVVSSILTRGTLKQKIPKPQIGIGIFYQYMRETKRTEEGLWIINKPSGPTSHDIINYLRKSTGIKKIGHAGTLDPLASGVLIVAVGRKYTKQISQFVKLDKKYIAKLYLGAESDTYDKEGKIIFTKNLIGPDIKKIKIVLKGFIGEQEQIPPMFSAKKYKGKKLYELARQGIKIKRKPVKINIYDLELLNYSWPFLTIKVHCSSGTYIRSLACDIGKKLGCGAYLEELERTAVGDFTIKEAIKIKLNSHNA